MRVGLCIGITNTLTHALSLTHSLTHSQSVTRSHTHTRTHTHNTHAQRSPSKRGVGLSFGPDVTKRFLELNNLDMVVRSHEVGPRLVCACVCPCAGVLQPCMPCHLGTHSREGLVSPADADMYKTLTHSLDPVDLMTASDGCFLACSLVFAR
jgi:hypothetical protein